MLPFIRYLGVADGNRVVAQEGPRLPSMVWNTSRQYLFEHGTLPALCESLEAWFDRYHHWRPHEKLGNLTPAVVYQDLPATPKAA